MKRLAVAVLALTLPFAVAACAELGLVPPGGAQARIEQQLEAFRVQYVDAYAQGDAGALAALYTMDAELLPLETDTVSGREAIEEFWENTFEGTMSRELTISPVEMGIEGGLLYEHGIFTAAFELEGGDTVTESGRYVVLLERQTSGQWQVLVHITNNSSAPAP